MRLAADPIGPCEDQARTDEDDMNDHEPHQPGELYRKGPEPLAN